MKKLRQVLSLFIIFTFLCLSVIPAYAQDTDDATQDDFLFYDDFVEYLGNMADVAGGYKELYYNYAESDGCIDWALLYCKILPLPWDVRFGVVVGDRVLNSLGGGDISRTSYIIYDVNKDTYIAVVSENMEQITADYPQLIDAVNDLQLGRPLGDINGDNKLSIIDATYIQRRLASFMDRVDLEGYGETDIDFVDSVYYGNGISTSNYISDIDLDGMRTILDATAIQLKLANIDPDIYVEPAVVAPYSRAVELSQLPPDCTAIDYQIVLSSNYYTGFSERDERAIIVRSRKQYEQQFLTYLSDQFDDEFFEENALVISVRMTSCDEATFNIRYLSVKEDTLYLSAVEYIPMDGWLSPSCPEYRCYASVDKDLLKGVNKIEFVPYNVTT